MKITMALYIYMTLNAHVIQLKQLYQTKNGENIDN